LSVKSIELVERIVCLAPAILKFQLLRVDAGSINESIFREIKVMAQTQKVLLLAIIVAIVAPIPGALAQDELSRFTPPATNRPILNTFRSRTTDNLVTDAFKRFSQNSPLSGKLCPKCAEKRNARFSEQAADKELLQKAKAATLEKLEQEAKKLKFEAKALEEADYEKHKPWDVAAPENKESPSPLLQAAQASKEDQDLAPKKIRALEYLAQLGCNKDPKVEAAIIAGLQDHNPAVRYARDSCGHRNSSWRLLRLHQPPIW
jgi:3-methyladenine DNA glycosylase AlkC